MRGFGIWIDTASEQDRIQYGFIITQNIVVTHSQDSIPLRFEESLTSHVVLKSPLMAVPVKFDNKFVLFASEVDNVGVDRMLSAKLDPDEPSAAQQRPELSLRPRHVTAKPTGIGDG